MKNPDELKTYFSNPEKYFTQRLYKKFPKEKFNLENTKNVIIYGASIVGKSVYTALKKNKIKVKFFVDKNRNLWGKKLFSVTIISPKRLKKDFKDSQIIIASVIYEKEIYQKLKKEGYSYLFPLSYLNFLHPKVFDFRDYNERYSALFKKSVKTKIKKVYNALSDKKSKEIYKKVISFRLNHYFNVDMASIRSKNDEYFEPAIFKLKNDEIFVDGGAYIGDTIDSYMKNSNKKYKQIYSFEPDKKNFTILEKYIKNHKLKNITPIKKGLYSKTGYVFFYSLGTPESGVGNKQEFSSWSGSIESKKNKAESIQVVSLDNFFKEKEPPTYIKMDIEGSEIAALNGSKKLIKKTKPKLVICLYHKPADLWEIPNIILSINSKYKLYVRHYSDEVCETIIYAI